MNTRSIWIALPMVFVICGLAFGYEGKPVCYPVIAQVVLVDTNGVKLDPIDLIELRPGEKYILTAMMQDSLDMSACEEVTDRIPPDGELVWDANFGEFEEDEASGNGVVWTAPEDPGEVVFNVVLTYGSGEESGTYEKGFRAWVGKPTLRPDYAPGIALVRFQDWCDEDCVREWASEPPGMGIDREISDKLNIQRIRIDPEVNVWAAVREITWWPSVMYAEPDIVIELLYETPEVPDRVE